MFNEGPSHPISLNRKKPHCAFLSFPFCLFDETFKKSTLQPLQNITHCGFNIYTFSLLGLFPNVPMVPEQSLWDWQTGLRGWSYLFLILQILFSTLSNSVIVPWFTDHINLRFPILAPDSCPLIQTLHSLLLLCSFFPTLFKPRLKATLGDYRVDIMGFFALLFSALCRKWGFCSVDQR